MDAEQKLDNPGGSARPVFSCRVCGGRDLPVVLDLGDQPACDYFPSIEDPGPDPRWPLRLMLCRACALAQLAHTSPSPEPPRAAESRTMLEHALVVAAKVVERTGVAVGSTAREFSSPHGGSWRAGIAQAGLKITTEGCADLVIDNHALIHEEDPNAAMAERANALAEDGWLVIEFQHALEQVRQAQFDTVRHGHPLYFSLYALSALLRRHGLHLADAWPEQVYGGCLIAVARKASPEVSASAIGILNAEGLAGITEPKGFGDLQPRAATIAASLRQHLVSARDAGRVVVGYGAGSKACTLLTVAGVDSDLIRAVGDISPAKHGRRIPGTRIAIVSPEELLARTPDEVVILTWDLADEVRAQLTHMGLRGATFTVPDFDSGPN